MMKKVFVCSPFRGDVDENLKVAKFAASILVACTYIPVVPHLYFPQFLDENDPSERIKGIKMGVQLMECCDRLWLVGTKITNGMEYELEEAKRLQIPVDLYDSHLAGIDPDTLLLDDRVDEEYRRKIEGLNLRGRR